jgi:hypothetical protein
MRLAHSFAQFLVALLFLGCPGVAGAGWLVYDDFSEVVIDPVRWFGSLTTGGGARPSADVNRVLKRGKLLLAMTQWGANNSDVGGVAGINALSVKDPAVIMGMEARIAMRRAEAEACPANPSVVTQSRARMLAGFFNDGSSTGPGDRTGDIVADIETVLDAGVGQVIRAVMFRCSDSSCRAGDSVVISTFTTTWQFKRPHAVRIVWDPANKKFGYAMKPKTGPEEVLEIPYTYDDSRSPGGKFAQLQARLSVPDCNGSRKHATIEFTADYVNILVTP